MAFYSIRDLEKLSGIKAHTIRMWEKRYNIVKPHRTGTNIRFYCDDDLKRILNVSILNRHGLKISRIAEMTDEQISEQVMHIARTTGDHESQIEQLIVSVIEFDDNRFEKSLSRVIMQMGFEETVLRVIYPFFLRIGILWQVGTVSPAQEHFASNLIRQKLLVAIDSQDSPPKPDARRFLLFLPEGELHEMGLLFFHYILKKHGHQVIYLGQSVPFSDLEEVISIRDLYGLITSFTTALPDFSMKEYLEKLHATFPGKKIFVTGLFAREHQEEIPLFIEKFTCPSDLISRIEAMASEH